MSQVYRYHTDHVREELDLPILQSVAIEFEELLLHDGCTGLAVLNPQMPAEVQLCDHKLLNIFSRNLAPYETILQEHGLRRDDSLQFISEAQHVHCTTDKFVRMSAELRTRLGTEGS